MRTKLVLSLLSFIFATVAVMAGAYANATACEHDTATIMRMEREILNAKESMQIAKPLACLLEIHAQAKGSLKYFAASYLRTLMGGGQIQGVMKDARYARVAEALSKITLKSEDPVAASVITEFARGDWDFYKLFCEVGNTEFCADFMPDADSVGREAPLLAAASMVRLKNAFFALSGAGRTKIAERIKNCIAKSLQRVPLERRFIDQIHRELFEGPPLSQA